MKITNKDDRTVVDVLAIKKIERDIQRKLTDEELEAIYKEEYLFLKLPNGSYYDYKPVELIPFENLFTEIFSKIKIELTYIDEEEKYDESTLKIKKLSKKGCDEENDKDIINPLIIRYNEAHIHYFNRVDEALLSYQPDNLLDKVIIYLHSQGKTSREIQFLISAVKIEHPNPRYRGKKIGKDFILARIKEFEEKYEILHIEFNK